MHLLEHARELKAQLEALGLDVAIDPRDVTIPGVFITPATFKFDRLAGSTGSADWSLIILGPYDVESALSDLGDRITLIAGAGFDLGEVSVVSITDPTISRDPIPALSTTLRTEWEDD